MKERYCYLVILESNGATRRQVVYFNREIEEKDILELEAEASRDRGEKFLAASVSLLNHKCEIPDNSQGGAFIVRNIETGESLYFDFRSEAIEHYNFLVSEQGQGSEIELLLRIRHHVPAELA